MLMLYAATTAIIIIAFLAFLIEEALRSHAPEQEEQDSAEAEVKLA